MNRIADFVRKSRDFFNWKYLFYIFKACGIAPINSNIEALQNANEESYKFSHSSKNIAYNLFTLFVITIANCLAAYGYFYMSDRDNEYVYYTSDIVGFSSAICNVAIFCIKCKQQIIIYNKMIEIRDNINGDSKDEGNNLCRKIHIAFAIYILVYLVLVISDSQSNFHFSMYCLGLDICHFIITSVAIQYWIVVEIMKNLYTALNAKLSHYWKHMDFTDQFTSAVEIGDNFSRFWQLYAELNKASRDISSLYSISMILFTINALLVPTSVIYVIAAKPIIIGDQQLTTGAYVSGICFVIPYLFAIVLLTSCVTAAVDESKKTREIVSALLRKSRSRVIREKLRQFSISLVDNVAEFTVFDFFSLNGSFVVSIVGSVTTYLVVLLQFQYKKCTRQD